MNTSTQSFVKALQIKSGNFSLSKNKEHRITVTGICCACGNKPFGFKWIDSLGCVVKRHLFFKLHNKHYHENVTDNKFTIECVVYPVNKKYSPKTFAFKDEMEMNCCPEFWSLVREYSHL